VYTGFRWENLRKRDLLEDPGVDGRIILRWIFVNWNVRAWTESIFSECGNVPSGSIKCEEFLD
jgi:hypothetical protein